MTSQQTKLILQIILDTVEVGIEVETKFNILIPDDHLEKMGTVGDLVTFVEKEVK